jgi:hypothetical protein
MRRLEFKVHKREFENCTWELLELSQKEGVEALIKFKKENVED